MIAFMICFSLTFASLHTVTLAGNRWVTPVTLYCQKVNKFVSLYWKKLHYCRFLIATKMIHGSLWSYLIDFCWFENHRLYKRPAVLLNCQQHYWCSNSYLCNVTYLSHCQQYVSPIWQMFEPDVSRRPQEFILRFFCTCSQTPIWQPNKVSYNNIHLVTLSCMFLFQLIQLCVYSLTNSANFLQIKRGIKYTIRLTPY